MRSSFVAWGVCYNTGPDPNPAWLAWIIGVLHWAFALAITVS